MTCIVKDVPLSTICCFYKKSSHTRVKSFNLKSVSEFTKLINFCFRLGQQQLLQVLNKLLALASNARQTKADPRAWSNMVWNTNTFTKSIFSVTGKDMTVFVDQWVRMGGHAKFVLKFVFNRKRNTVELEINQDAANNMEQGVRKYVGPVKIALQELDGQFPHTFQVLFFINIKKMSLNYFICLFLFVFLFIGVKMNLV